MTALAHASIGAHESRVILLNAAAAAAMDPSWDTVARTFVEITPQPADAAADAVNIAGAAASAGTLLTEDCTMLDNVDFLKHDTNSQRVADAGACCRKCMDEDFLCDGFSFSGGTCWLKSLGEEARGATFLEQVRQQHKHGVVSGVPRKKGARQPEVRGPRTQGWPGSRGLAHCFLLYIFTIYIYIFKVCKLLSVV